MEHLVSTCKESKKDFLDALLIGFILSFKDKVVINHVNGQELSEILCKTKEGWDVEALWTRIDGDSETMKGYFVNGLSNFMEFCSQFDSLQDVALEQGDLNERFCNYMSFADGAPAEEFTRRLYPVQFRDEQETTNIKSYLQDTIAWAYTQIRQAYDVSYMHENGEAMEDLKKVLKGVLNKGLSWDAIEAFTHEPELRSHCFDSDFLEARKHLSINS